MKALPERRITDAVDDRLTAAGMTALIVDDESSYRGYISALAEKVGFTVEEAIDGPTALEMLSKTAFDVLIVNLDSPGINGLERIAPHETYAILLTSRDDVDKKIAALEAGYDDFLSKSATELEVVAKLVAARRLITRQQTFDNLVRDLYGLASRDELTGATLTQLLEAADRDLYKNKWVRRHPDEARSAAGRDHVLPLPEAVSELSTIRTSRRSNENSPLPRADRPQRPGARRHHTDD